MCKAQLPSQWPKMPNKVTCIGIHTNPHRGVALLAALIFLSIVGLVGALSLEMAATAGAREREKDLLYIGEQFRTAISRYYFSTPGPIKALPSSLEDLVDDNRFPKPLHHIREIYVDPMTGLATWGQIQQGAKIVGVYSLGARKPIKVAEFSEEQQSFTDAPSYSDWKFIFKVPAPIPSPFFGAGVPGGGQATDLPQRPLPRPRRP
jgi:hypothetical protein